MPAIRVRRRKVAKRGYRKRRQLRRQLLNRSPTFTETYQKAADNVRCLLGGSVGSLFEVRITDIPQVVQYANLYTQYKINWVKVMLIPQFNTLASDKNAAIYNVANPPISSAGMARIVYSVQDSPGQTAPATELEVLEDNGCRIRAMGKMWSCSFRPVPSVEIANQTGGTTFLKSKVGTWFNFDTATPNNNPMHQGVKTFITLPGSTSDSDSITWYAYYKVNFSLRDPQ